MKLEKKAWVRFVTVLTSKCDKFILRAEGSHQRILSREEGVRHAHIFILGNSSGGEEWGLQRRFQEGVTRGKEVVANMGPNAGFTPLSTCS